MEEVSKHALKLIKKKEIANSTMAFYFEKPAGFAFRPGQSMDFVNPEHGEMKTFSIASAPHENVLLFAMRLRGSPFKEYLSKMNAGETIAAHGPFGRRFILPGDAATPLVFIAGGIGITPILSMISHVAREKLNAPITLFYSNKNEDDISFRKELEELAEGNANIKVVFTLTNKYNVSSDWRGEVRRVDGEMIQKYISDITTPLFYTSGTPQMVTSMTSTLEKVGVPADHIVTKKFTGY
jgi:ferredoxin-NADP reductase